MNTSWLTNNIKAVLAIIVVVLGISYFYMCSIRDIKPDPQILIAMVSSIGVCLGYYFGSSQKSEKTDAPQVTQTGDNPIVNASAINPSVGYQPLTDIKTDAPTGGSGL